jgi:hypothetical protein
LINGRPPTGIGLITLCICAGGARAATNGSEFMVGCCWLYDGKALT